MSFEQAVFDGHTYGHLSVNEAAYKRGWTWAFIVPERDDLERMRNEWDRSRIRPHDRDDFSPELLREAQRMLVDRLRDETDTSTENYLTATIFGASSASEIPEAKIMQTLQYLYGETDSEALEIIIRSRDSTIAAKTAAGFIEGALEVINAAGLDAPEPSPETIVVSEFGPVGYLGRRYRDCLKYSGWLKRFLDSKKG